MPKSVQMPQLGESVTEGTVTRWLKKEGERVEADEPLLEVSTDKVDTEIPSPTAGILTKIVVAEDETVEVGAELAVIDENGSAGAAPAQEAAPEPEPEPAQPISSIPQPAPQAAAPAPEPAPAPQAAAPAPAPQAPAPQAPAPQAAPAQQAPAPQAAPAQQAPAPISGDSPYVTPLVRKLAGEHNVDLDALNGTGVGGRIRKQDVLEAARNQREQAAAQAPAPQAAAPQAQAAAPAQAPEPVAVDTTLRGRTEKMSRLRQTIAKRMVESLQVSAQLTSVVEVDVTKIAQLRDRAKAEFQRREGVKLSFMPFFALAAIEALKQHPKLNATINSETNEVTYFDAEHLGFATDTERGLLVPVIKDAGDLNIAGLARKIADLAERTRTNKVSPDELGGGTFTLTNTGSRGALFDTPILNQPQVGMLGTGAVVKRPVVLDTAEGEVIAVRSMVYLALSYDHRLVDGADAARFLTTIKRRLEEGRFENQLGLNA
ncbi:2-oxoglutarate dehydrogenase, E2 component, dihydrolipoamide succinyltransferase [Streptosporangium canum]|uniref:Dihydrolipoamide acetyltransferase component of pyruvate dehydrogenase complex n=1 Tax=Streptosporangium canum TaxID=324952 RepID=A0A1I3PKW1_9ACTN|nr:2-oxoglutarate dehydrogenase, E2 component, dihydrolipoamide succinyltransferase [Streptosporangium canum]SFJ22344.1 2-oxoglutarate dehydrogenase E2 component [Streptosporangium canum]